MPHDSVSSDSEEEDEGRKTGVWLVLRLLSGLLRASRRWRLPLNRLRGCRSEGPPSAADESQAEGLRTVVGLPVMGKPAVVARIEPLACSQAKGWGRGLPTHSPIDVTPQWKPGVCCVLTGVHWPGQVVAFSILGCPVARIPHTSGVRAVWQRFPRPGEVVGAALLSLRVSVGIWER